MADIRYLISDVCHLTSDFSTLFIDKYLQLAVFFFAF